MRRTLVTMARLEPRVSPPRRFLSSNACNGETHLREQFVVAAREVGQQSSELPLWALQPERPPQRSAFGFLWHPFCRNGRSGASVRDVSGLVGGFQVLNLMTPAECQGFVAVLDALGFHEDAAVSLPYSIRHMSNCNLVVPEAVDGELFERCRKVLPVIGGCEALGLNAKFRCYKYGPGDYFKPHTDGAWPGSRVHMHCGTGTPGWQFVPDAYGDRISQLTFLVLLSEDYHGGETRFVQLPGGAPDVSVRTPVGAALCFPHGYHPDSPLHAGELVSSGFKYMIRTEVLYSVKSVAAVRQQRSTL
eukprot:TRINITY_DN68014_c0_g1_i1.p1 TRINITY_DN68014_c0_g1~~TRINITY_DN68014_c0_g1_i1.p1  ORF type:complete len:304 (-),score=33.62 TRINITY_DN68014_c0_g1_i1:85-996(-)